MSKQFSPSTLKTRTDETLDNPFQTFVGVPAVAVAGRLQRRRRHLRHLVERTWYVTELYNADGRTSSLDEAQHQQLGNRRDAYRISFTPETFNAQAGSTTLTGTWTVDGSNQTIRFHFDRPVTGEDAISRIMIKYLEEAVRYEGSYIYLRIYTEAGTSILFSPDK